MLLFFQIFLKYVLTWDAELIMKNTLSYASKIRFSVGFDCKDVMGPVVGNAHIATVYSPLTL